MSEANEKKDKPLLIEIGRSGTYVTGFKVSDDYLDNLNGVSGQEIFHKMEISDSTYRKIVHAVNNPIKSATWDIEPASDDKKDLDIAALIKNILFNDLPDGFKAKLDEILLFPWRGHSVFEVIHKNRTNKEFGAYTGLANLAFRDQRTLTEWHFNQSTGVLEQLKQYQSGDIPIDTFLPIDTLLIFYNEKKGNDSGFPFARMMYGNYKRKLLYKELQAIGIERAAIAVPHLELPQGVEYGDENYEDAKEQLAAFTQAEQAYFITPYGYKINYNQTGTFDPSKTQVAIKAENEEMAGSLVAMWLEMGIGGNSAVGSSTSESLSFFRDGIEYLADKIKDVFNLKLIPNLVRLNFGEVEKYPKLIHSGIADEAGKELMEIVTGYVEKGVITADEILEDHVRKAHNLPKKAEGELLDNKVKQDETQPGNNNNSTASVNGTPNNNEHDRENPTDEVTLSLKKNDSPKVLMDIEGNKTAQLIRDNLKFSAGKYINDVMNRYKQLPENKKQKATDKIKMGGGSRFKKELKRSLTNTTFLAMEMARSEVPIKKDIILNNREKDILRMVETYGDISHIELNEYSKFPSYIQVLIAKQSELISNDSLNDLKKRIDFSYSSIETKSSDENFIRQSMEDEANKFIDSNQVEIKGNNVCSLVVNEGRSAFFFDDDVIDEIHSFTFVNIAPVAAICKELAGTTFYTNDAESLRYSPPLHHNCKSYLRANLKTSKGIDKLKISTLSPTATAKKSITL